MHAARWYTRESQRDAFLLVASLPLESTEIRVSSYERRISFNAYTTVVRDLHATQISFLNHSTLIIVWVHSYKRSSTNNRTFRVFRMTTRRCTNVINALNTSAILVQMSVCSCINQLYKSIKSICNIHRIYNFTFVNFNKYHICCFYIMFLYHNWCFYI